MILEKPQSFSGMSANPYNGNSCVAQRGNSIIQPSEDHPGHGCNPGLKESLGETQDPSQ